MRVRCQHHPGLIATWVAIHWLIILHAASGRTDFGMREIAAEAGVSRNALAGKRGYIKRLVELDLLHIVGSTPMPGLCAPRPIYTIDLADLERHSLEIVPEVLRDRQILRPPPAAPEPRHASLLDLIAAIPPRMVGTQTPGMSQPPPVPLARVGFLGVTRTGVKDF